MKKFKGFNKGLVYALVTSMVLSCGAGIGPLEVNAATTGTVNADALNVRSGAGTGYSRVGTVTQGQTLNILETVQGSDGYTWYKVSGAASGYVRGDFISNVVSDTPTRPTSSAGTITADWLNVRTGAGTNFSRLGSVAQGTRLTVISVHGEWYKVTCQIDGTIQTGYVHSQYVQMDGDSGSSNNNSNNNNNSGNTNTAVIATGVVNVDALNVRTGASTGDAVLGVLRKNESVEILSQEGSWYKVRCSVNGSTQEGYVYAEYISKTSDNSNNNTNNNTSTGTGVVNADALNVRTGAGTNNSAIGLLHKIETVEILSQTGSWYQVRCTVNGSETTGYVSAEYITRTNDNNTGGNNSNTTPTYEKKNGVVNADALKVRTGAGTGNSVIGMIYQNASVTIIGEENGWYKVSCVVNGTTREGYVSAEYITIVDNSSNNNSNNNNNNNSNNNSAILPGDLKYEDWNGDGYIDDYDQRPIGRNAYPELVYGINLGLSWKGVDFSMFWQGGALSDFQIGAFDMDAFQEGATNLNTWEYFGDRWHRADYTDPNSEWIPGYFPAVRDFTSVTINRLSSNFWMWNGSYIRLKNVELGYTLPQRITQKANIKQLRIYANLYNCLTFSSQKFFDPEQLESQYSFASYPQIMSFNVGINLKF